MRAILLLIACSFLWVTAPQATWADDSTPIPVATSAPVDIAPTSAPVPLPVPQPQPTAAPPTSDGSSPGSPSGSPSAPVPVAREHATPVVQYVAPASPPTALPESQPTLQAPPPVNLPPPAAVIQSTSQTSSPTTSAPQTSAPNFPAPQSQSPSAPPIPQTAPNTNPDTNSTADLGSIITAPTSASAPAQLTCHGKNHPTSSPFMVSPYRGWTEVASFLDHDSPDYAVDGVIVLANGLRATAADGQESDLFPAYWSPALRQYVNYDGHNGYDLDISYQPVLAAASGTVEFAGWNEGSVYGGYGQMILIDHHNGYVTLYGHLSQLDVKTGDTVTAGQEIAISGTTGHSSGPHLHFSVFHDCQVTDPYGWSGAGRDPLRDFDNEKASYLWLPGHDPLILNPPPNWPTYPLGLRISAPGLDVPGLDVPVAPSRQKVPPADRLLLLHLPDPVSGTSVGADVALVRTESLITQEGQALAPQLRDLQAQGLLDSYQLIPAAAAVWVRGTATAPELEGLAGVASLAGVQPHDISNAQAGLAHSVLIQIGRQQAPSLWPVGFRSAFHAWRPDSTVAIGHALLTGFALPGAHVVVSLHRNNTVPAAAEATGDPETGGFVAMLHDAAGEPVVVESGDVIEIVSGGKTARVLVAPLSLEAHSGRIIGHSPPGSTVPVAVTYASGEAGARSVTSAGSSGLFHVASSRPLPPGTLAVASTVDAAGDQIAASAFVPGIEVQENGPIVRGWTAGSRRVLRVIRDGKPLLTRTIHSATDGAFQTELRTHHEPFLLAAGDLITLGSRWHSRSLTLPLLSAALTAGSRQATLSGPAGAHIELSYAGQGITWTKMLAPNQSGRRDYTLPVKPAAVGDALTLRYTAKSGDSVTSVRSLLTLHVDLSRNTLNGVAKPGSIVSLRVFDLHGRALGGGVGATDVTSGKFSAPIVWIDRRSHSAAVPMTLAVRSSVTTQTVQVPVVRLEMGTGGGTRTLQTSPLQEMDVLTTGQSRQPHAYAVRTDARGQTTIATSGIKRLSIVVPLGNGIETAEDYVTNPAGTLVPAGVTKPHRLSCTRTPALSAAKQHAVRAQVARCAASVRSKR